MVDADSFVSWFPTGKSDSSGWRFDVITLLAVIGESSVAEHAQAISGSFLCMLPRIIPAPQALLRATRPLRMPEVTAKMAGVYSGVVLDSVGFFANIIHPLDDMRAFSFRVLEIKHRDPVMVTGEELSPMQPPSNSRRRFGGSLRTPLKPQLRIPGPPVDDNTAPGDPRTFNKDPRIKTLRTGLSAHFGPDPERAGMREFGPPKRRLTVKEKMTDMLSNPTMHNKKPRPAIPPKLWSPVHILSIFSAILSAGLIGAAAYWGDGTAIVAIASISLVSSVTGYASWWRPLLSTRSNTNRVPKGDVMIRTREGAFVLIRCTEDVSRELYSGTEECSYHVGDRNYRALMGVSTLLLMVAVVLLGNCNWNMQVFVGGSYITLNGLYWGMGLLPRELFWDLSRYEWHDITPEDAKYAEAASDESDVHLGVPSYTRTLWYGIRETKRTGWVKRSGAAATTDQWNKWLVEAEHAAKSGNRKWNAVLRKDAIMREWESHEVQENMEIEATYSPATRNQASVSDDSTATGVEVDRGVDEALQHVPADEVQRPMSTVIPKSGW